MPRPFALAFFVAVLTASLPSTALACACCDGGDEARVVGWSPSGNTALVRRRSVGCEDTLALEIVRRGADAPVGCFDVYGAHPDRRVACDALRPGYDRWGPGDPARPTTSPRAGDFPGAVSQIAASHVRATLTPMPERDGDLGFERRRLEVFVLDGGRWRSIHTESLLLGRPEDGRDLEDLSPAERLVARAPLPIEVRIWPSPNGGPSALLEVAGALTEPGIGFFPEAMRWVELPGDPSAWPRVADGRVLAAAAFERGARVEPSAARAAGRLNGAGLRAHRAGRFERAEELFAMAAMVDPTDVMARYDLACAMARRGQLEGALALLRTIALPGCAPCRERMERARVDPDLAALRARLPSIP